jgi:cell division protein FtsB
MTTQPTIEDIGAKWGGLLNQAFVSIVALEKELKSAQAQIQEMTKNEARLIENIQDLEDELAARIPSYTLSPEGAKIASEAREIIQSASE